MPRSFVPYDASIDTPMGHRHLILIYCAVWGLQVAYAVYALWRWNASRNDEPNE